MLIEVGVLICTDVEKFLLMTIDTMLIFVVVERLDAVWLVFPLLPAFVDRNGSRFGHHYCLKPALFDKDMLILVLCRY